MKVGRDQTMHPNVHVEHKSSLGESTCILLNYTNNLTPPLSDRGHMRIAHVCSPTGVCVGAHVYETHTIRIKTPRFDTTQKCLLILPVCSRHQQQLHNIQLHVYKCFTMKSSGLDRFQRQVVCPAPLHWRRK